MGEREVTRPILTANKRRKTKSGTSRRYGRLRWRVSESDAFGDDELHLHFTGLYIA